MKKSRVLILISVSVVLLVASIIVFVSCSNNEDNSKTTLAEPSHEHIESDWIVDKNATSSAEGKRHKECIECGVFLKEEIIPMLQIVSEGLEFALNEDGESYSVVGIGTCTDTEIIIPSEYNGKPVTVIGEMAFAPLDYENEIILESNINSVVIPDTIIDIRMGAFAYCRKMENVTIGNSVETIEKMAFYNCELLTSIVIPKSIVSIGEEAFMGCWSLVEVCNKSSLNLVLGEESYIYGLVSGYAKHIIYDESESAIKRIGDFVFYDDGTEVYFVKYLGDENEITLPKYNGEQKYGIWWCAFRYNKEITSIVIPDCVTSIGYMAFEECTSLRSVTMDDSVTIIEYDAFYGCVSLSNIKLSASLVYIYDGAFYDCSSLTNIIIPDSVSYIGSTVFYGCTSLEIFCEATCKPEGWSTDWNSGNCPVVWDYKNK